MRPCFLIPETTVQKSGSGEVVEIGEGGGMALLSLGITHVEEQQSLDVEIEGSADGEEWAGKPLRAFPQKFYTGVWQVLCDLSASSDVRFLRVSYKVARWGVGPTTPRFRFYVFAEPYVT
ncbi:MAG: hypothetical protein OXN89_01910 [Bryobacterales bacterium]|nr:hypothetical protein [Bryobacterales bacterium]